MKLRHATVVSALVLTASVGVHRGEAADPAANAVRRTLPFMKSQCAVATDVRKLGDLYWTRDEEFHKELQRALQRCNVTTPVGSYLIVLFTAPPTAGGTPLVISTMYRQRERTLESVHGVTGVERATWVFLTDDENDEIRGELLISKQEHPALAQVGKLAAALIGSIPFTVSLAGQEARDMTTHKFVAEGTLVHKRASIQQVIYIQRKKVKAADTENKQTADTQPEWQQLEGKSSFNNTPLTWVKLNAGAAVFTGAVRGARRMAIDGGKFVSNPTPRAATLAGVTWHLPFDGTAVAPDPRESHGIFTGAVLTPSAGVAVAYSYGWRGFSLLGGYGVMWVESAKENSRVNTAVGENEGLIRRKAHGLLFGGSYAFGG